MPPSPCRYPNPIPPYGTKVPCKNGKKPCSELTECWGMHKGDVVKSMNCQQEYIRDLASFLFASNTAFRSAWLEYAKAKDMPATLGRINSLKQYVGQSKEVKDMTEAYNERLSMYEAGIKSDNNVTNDALLLLEREIAGSNITKSTDLAEFKANIVKTLKSAFPDFFSFDSNNKINFQTPPPNKTCGDLTPYFTFIYNVNILLDEGRTKRTGGKKTRRSKKSKRATRRR